MEITYKNRKDDTYYLHEGKTKIGNPKYFFSKKIKGKIIDKIPDGFEIYENIDALVFLRKIQPKIITDEEVNTVKSHLEKCTHIPHWQVEVKKNTIIVYTSDDYEKSLDELAKKYSPYLNTEKFFELC